MTWYVLIYQTSLRYIWNFRHWSTGDIRLQTDFVYTLNSTFLVHVNITIFSWLWNTNIIAKLYKICFVKTGLKIIVVLNNFYSILSCRQASAALSIIWTISLHWKKKKPEGLNIHTIKYQKGMMRAQDKFDWATVN